MHQKLSLGFIIGISIIVIASWMFLVVPDLKSNPEYFEAYLETRVFASIATNVGELLPESPTNLLTTLKHDVVEQDGKIVQIKSVIITEDLFTGNIIFNYEKLHDVDLTTKKYINYDAYFSLPLNTQKQSYNFYVFSENKSLKYNFKRTEIVNGLEAFIFSANAVWDISGNSPLFPSETLLQHIQLELWVEPKTGRILGYESDWILNAVREGQEILIGKGHAKTTDFSFAIQSENYKKQIELFYLYDTIIPVLLVAISTGSILVVFVNQNLRTRTEELKKAKKEKFETLGQLAANLAHDIRNPLSVISNSMENLKRTYGTDDKKQSHFDRVERAIMRITHQVDDVLSFVKEQPLTLDKTKMSEVISESLDSLKIPSEIKLILPENDVELICDKTQLAVALNNLILNSIQAIDGIGTIIISFEENKDTIVIEVEDSGKDISKEELDVIFEPLFTTKQHGTGLGLVSVKSIIRSHGGTISVTSPPVIFTITLPKRQ